MTGRTFGLVAVIILIIGSVAYLELQKNRPMLPVVPNAGDIPIEVAIENAGREIFSASSGVPAEPVPPADEPAASQGTAPLPNRVTAKMEKYPRVKEIVSPSGFVNVAGGFKLANIVGKKVILIDFWTYSCINCQRTQPYLNAWYEKYKDQGLEIVGIHTPEFDFEKKQENVQNAVTEEGVRYPVVMDNNYATWSAYGNRFWPRKYLIDIDGFIVFDHIGEGAYELTEKQIQLALAERALTLKLDQAIAGGVVSPDMGSDTPPQDGPISPETYFGSLRNQTLANGTRGIPGEQTLTAPSTFVQHALYLHGTWNIAPEYAENMTAGSEIIFSYQAKNVYVVASADAGVKVRVLRDGKPLTADLAGEDVKIENGESFVQIQEDRLYKLIKEGVSQSHVLELIIESPGVRAFTFTFG